MKPRIRLKKTDQVAISETIRSGREVGFGRLIECLELIRGLKKTDQDAVAEAIRSGREVGFGKLIGCLHLAWARELVVKHGIGVKVALIMALVGKGGELGWERLGRLGRRDFLKVVGRRVGERG